MRETGIFATIYLLICMVVCADDSPLVVGYYSSWLKNQTEAIGFSKYSHVIVSFANPCTNGSFVFPDFDVPDAVSKIHKDNAKALVSIGGWSYSTNFSSIMKDTTARTALADNIVTYVDENKLDGIDIDWEFPGVDSGQAGNGVDQANDTPNYLKLLQDLRKKLDAKFADDKKLITMAVGSQPFNVNGKPSTDLSEFAKVVDYANLMLYDFYGSWSKTSGPNAPLNGDGLSFMSVIKAWTDAKWPASKLTAGMAFYGHSVTLSSIGKDISTNQFQSKSDVVPKGDEGDVKETTSANFTGMWQYNYLRTGVLLDAAGKTAEHWTRYWDNSSMTPYLVNDQDKRFISYDDQQSIQAKVQFAKSCGIAGGMVWSMHMDYENELVDVIRAWKSDNSTDGGLQSEHSAGSNSESNSSNADSESGGSSKTESAETASADAGNSASSAPTSSAPASASAPSASSSGFDGVSNSYCSMEDSSSAGNSKCDNAGDTSSAVNGNTSSAATAEENGGNSAQQSTAHSGNASAGLTADASATEKAADAGAPAGASTGAASTPVHSSGATPTESATESATGSATNIPQLLQPKALQAAILHPALLAARLIQCLIARPTVQQVAVAQTAASAPKMMHFRIVALILTLLAHVLNAGASQLVVGYYDVTKQDEARDVDLSKYTHLNLAFGAPNKDGSISFGQGVSLGDVVGKLNATKLKVLVSIGGWSGSRWFSGIMKDAAASSTMISNIIDIIDTNKLAGVDILWEYPGRAAGSCYAFDADADTTNFLKFLQTLREQLDSKFGSSKKLITLAVRIEPFDVKGSPSTDVSAFAKLVDYAHLMPFEINGAGQDTTGPLAPLNFEKGKGQPYSFVSAIDVWVNAGWPASQLTAGVSFSGRSASTVSDMTKDPTNQYQKQFNEVPKGDPEDGYWKDVCTDNIEISGQWQYKYLRKLGLLTAPTTAAPSIVRQWDSTSQTPWLFNTTVNRFYTYDDPESIKAKVDYAASKGLAGTMVWLVHMDYQNELIDAVVGTNSTISQSSSSASTESKSKACLRRRAKRRNRRRHTRSYRNSARVRQQSYATAVANGV
ncbi:hypothetical protein IWW55_002677 [Coemansia sp. RSA 2706]|nr:hypothetical protein IWW55_002677 [Coemansia sp. RSA 2706]